MATPPPCGVSVVIPLYHNAGTIADVVGRLAHALAGETFEIVGVDDGGGDETAEIFEAEARRLNIMARLICHPQNLGQNAAVLTGLEGARGEIIVVMDGDLQDPPEVVPRLLESLAGDGPSMALGLRTGRWARIPQVLGSRIFKKTLFSLLGSDLPVRVGLFLAMRRSVRDTLLRQATSGDYLVGHLAALGLPAGLVKFPRTVRPGGGSSYSWHGRTRLARQGLRWAWRHRKRPFLPLHALGCGLTAAAISFLLLLSQPFGLQDDGFRYLLSSNWASGTDIFSDFHLLYLPGAYVWYGGWMSLLGHQLWVLRLGQALLTGLSAGLVLAPVRRHAGLRSAWATGLLLAVIGTGFAKMAAMAAVVAAILSLDRVRRFGTGRFLVLGAATGLLFGWREDSAVLMAMVTLGALVVSRSGRRAWAATAVGAIVGFGFWLAVFAANGEAGAFLAHVIDRLQLLAARLTPAHRTHWPGVSRVEMHPPRAFAVRLLPVFKYLPLALYGGLLVGYGVSRLRRRPWPVATVLAALAGVAFLPQFLWEFPDVWHFRSHLACLAIVAAAGLGALGGRLRSWLAAALSGAALVAAALLLWQHAAERAVLYPVAPGRSIGARIAGGCPPWAGLPHADGETMIALPWCPGWYALEAPRNGTRILSFLRRHRTTGRTAELDQDLRRSTNRYLILKSPSPGQLSSLPAKLRGTIRSRYRYAATWSSYDLWVRAEARRRY